MGRPLRSVPFFYCAGVPIIYIRNARVHADVRGQKGLLLLLGLFNLATHDEVGHGGSHEHG